MGPESERAGVRQGPVLRLELQGPGARRQQGAIGRGQDRHLGIATIQAGPEVLHQRRWCHLLKGAPGDRGGQGLVGVLGRAGLAAEAVAAGADQHQGHENPADQSPKWRNPHASRSPG
jgi:hypothetical protein